MADISVSEFADKINEIIPVILREFIKQQANELHKGKITLPQFLIMDFLSRQGESKMTVLANFMNVTTAAMTGIVERLVRDGYVSRINDKADRRVINIKLTAKGSSLVKRITEQKNDMVIKTFGRISGNDRAEYLRILTNIKDILIKDRVD